MNKILFSFLFLIGIAHAQGGSIQGKVEDVETSSPIQYVNANLPLGKAGFTNELGLFYIEDIKPGNYKLLVTHIGYKTEIIPIEIKKNLETNVSIQLIKTGLDLSEVKVGGKKASSLNTFAAIDIKLRPVSTSQDMLRIVPGIFIAQHAGGGKAEQIFLRGYDLDHGTDINISADGMPVNMVSHAHGQGYSDLHFLIPETIEKVNFNHGPYNAQYGNMATAGYVSFKTKDFINNSSIKLEAGRFDTKRASGIFKIISSEKINRRRQLYIASEYFLSEGYFKSPQNFHRFNTLAKYNAIKNNSQLTIISSHFNSKWNASGQIPDRAVTDGLIDRYGSIDDTEGGETGRSNLSVIFKRQLQKGWKTTDQLYFTKYSFDLYSNFTFFLKDSINGDQINQKENRTIYGYLGNLKKEWNKIDAVTEVGYGFRFDNIKDIELAHSVKRKHLNSVQKGKIKEGNIYLYIQQFLQLNKWNFSTGIRLDQQGFSYTDQRLQKNKQDRQSRTTINPKLSVGYAHTNSTKFFLSMGSGYHSNDTRIILQGKAKEILPRVYGIDAGIILKPAKNIILKTTLWKLYSETEFVYIGDEGIVEPAGRSMRTGIDLSIRYQIAKWLFADIDADLARPRAIDAPKGEQFIPLAPIFSSIGGITVKNKENLSGSVRYRYLQNRPANEIGDIKAKGYFITDVMINYQLKNLELFISVDNLFNAAWREAQFATESRLRHELVPVTEIHYTAGAPLFYKTGLQINF